MFKEMEIEKKRGGRRILVVRGEDDNWTLSCFLTIAPSCRWRKGGERKNATFFLETLAHTLLFFTLRFDALEAFSLYGSPFQIARVSPLIQKSSPLCLAARGGIYKAKFVHRMPWARKHKW
jgi:hypothetical protein